MLELTGEVERGSRAGTSSPKLGRPTATDAKGDTLTEPNRGRDLVVESIRDDRVPGTLKMKSIHVPEERILAADAWNQSVQRNRSIRVGIFRGLSVSVEPSTRQTAANFRRRNSMR